MANTVEVIEAVKDLSVLAYIIDSYDDIDEDSNIKIQQLYQVLIAKIGDVEMSGADLVDHLAAKYGVHNATPDPE